MANFKWNDKKLRKVAEDIAMRRLVKVGFMVEREAKKLTPVDTGRLRASISTNWTGSGMSEGKTGKQASAVTLKGRKTGRGKAPLRTGKSVKGIGRPSDRFTVVVGTNVAYSAAVEFGKQGQRAQPFLRPAFRGVIRFVNRMF